MKIKTIITAALILGIVILAGCSGDQQYRSDQYSNVYGGAGGQNPPPQIGGGCGVVMPAEGGEFGSASEEAL